MEKYSVVDLTNEERDAFSKDFEALMEKHSVYFEPIPKIERKDMQSPWQLGCNVLLLKKVKNETIKETEKPVEAE